MSCLPSNTSNFKISFKYSFVYDLYASINFCFIWFLFISNPENKFESFTIIINISKESCFVYFFDVISEILKYDVNFSFKGSLFVTRPTLFSYIANRDEYNNASHQLYSRVSDGRLKVYIHDKMPLEKIVEAHNELEGRKTKGGLVITL